MKLITQQNSLYQSDQWWKQDQVYFYYAMKDLGMLCVYSFTLSGDLIDVVENVSLWHT